MAKSNISRIMAAKIRFFPESVLLPVAANTLSINILQ